MPYELIYKEAEGIVITNYSGVLTDEEFRECAEKKFSSIHEIENYRYSISDFSELTEFEVSTSSVIDNAANSKIALETNSRGFMAVVVADDLLFGMGRMWEAYTESNPDRVRIFKSRVDADAWIAEKLAQSKTSG